MPDIKLLKPIELDFDLVEIEDTFPSMKFKLSLRINHPTGYFSYSAHDIWFSRDNWDLFRKRINNLNYDGSETVVLSDFSEYVLLKLILKEGRATFQIIIKEIIPNGGEPELNYTTEIDKDEIAHLVNVFNDFSLS